MVFDEKVSGDPLRATWYCKVQVEVEDDAGVGDVVARGDEDVEDAEGDGGNHQTRD